MTRFVITIDQGIDFVIRSLEEMNGGEIFVPKIPSIKITDLAKAFSPKLPIKIIGIRSGEKLHEILCPRDDAHLTIEFKDYYILKPSIKYIDRKINFYRNKLGSKGKKVSQDFHYSSLNNKQYINIQKLKKIIESIN